MARIIPSIVVLSLASACAYADAYSDSIAQWRAEREAKLKSDTGWLTVAGLFWLEEGENRAGADASAKIALPEGSAPRLLGTFTLRGSETTFDAANGVLASVNGTLLKGPRAMKWDAADESPDLLTHGDLTFFVIKRGERFAIRMRDKNSAMRRDFTGLHWYPVDPSYRVEAKWMPYKEPKRVGVPNIVNIVEQHTALGYAEFRLGGKLWKLEPVVEGAGEKRELFFIFKDATAGGETYPAGRFLYSAMPKDGKVLLDFNKAYTPPCAFTPFATCPLPTKENRLAARIAAGELNYGHH